MMTDNDTKTLERFIQHTSILLTHKVDPRKNEFPSLEH